MSAAPIEPRRIENRGARFALICDVLDLFVDRRTPIAFREILRETGADRRTAYAYLQAFEARGWVERLSDGNPRKAGQAWKRGPRLEPSARRFPT